MLIGRYFTTNDYGNRSNPFVDSAVYNGQPNAFHGIMYYLSNKQQPPYELAEEYFRNLQLHTDVLGGGENAEGAFEQEMFNESLERLFAIMRIATKKAKDAGAETRFLEEMDEGYD
jgi:hypothetical protein